MSIPSTTKVDRVPSSTTGRAPSAAAVATARQGGANATASPATSDEAAPAQATPPRFPWLSRLAQQLESAAKQKPAFPSAPILGDNVDKSA